MKRTYSKTNYDSRDSKPISQAKTSYEIVDDIWRQDIEKKVLNLDTLVKVALLVLIVMVGAIIVDVVISHITDSRWHIQFENDLQERLGK